LPDITAVFGRSSGEDAPENDKLLHLYWNRNELKKEFATMRKEQFRLKDEIQQQVGATARLQQKLDHLEGLLVDPEWSRSVVVLYQLRGLASRCEGKLARFAEQIKQQRERKQNAKAYESWNGLRLQDTAAINLSILEHRNNIQCLEDERKSATRELAGLGGFFRLFGRRKVAAAVRSLSDRIHLEVHEEDTFKQKLGAVSSREHLRRWAWTSLPSVPSIS